MLNIEKEVAVLQRMTVHELRERYREVFREESRSRNKQFLWKRSRGGYRHWKKEAFPRGPVGGPWSWQRTLKYGLGAILFI